MKILLTGGLGFIGSHTAVMLTAAGHEPILLDNLTNCRRETLDKITMIAGRPIRLYEGDVLDTNAVRQILSDEKIDAVIHFAGLKAVSESIEKPLDYHRNNVGGLISVLEAMNSEGVRSLIFSSSATVYGDPQYLPVDEDHPTATHNPYGQTKLICEQILGDIASGDGDWRITLLRYFNPVGAHPSGLIGESPTGVPNNLMPLLTQAAEGKIAALSVFGDDYPTHDGSAIRDFIHVMDLAEGHIAALIAQSDHSGLEVYNLGTGRGFSVLQIIAAFELATGLTVPHVIAARRPGDIGAVYAEVSKAERELNWQAKRNLSEMCLDSWRFASTNGPF